MSRGNAAPRLRRVGTPDGLAIAATDWGGGAARDILFIHGFAQSQSCWARQVDSNLLRDFRLASYDLRGHGRSSKPTEPTAYRDPRLWAEELAAVIDALELDRPVVVAWSYGGRVVLDYLAQQGDAGIAGLVMVAATSSSAAHLRGPAAARMGAMGSPVAAEAEAALAAFAAECTHDPLPAEEAAAFLRESAATPAFVRRALAGREAAYDATLAGLRRPVLAINGAEDRVTLPAMATHTATRTPQGRALFYPATGHMPFWEQHARFNADLAAFARNPECAVFDP